MKVLRLSIFVGSFVFCAMLGVLLNEALAHDHSQICDKSVVSNTCPGFCEDIQNGGNCIAGGTLYTCTDLPESECSLGKCGGLNEETEAECSCTPPAGGCS
jgi:hypothetical protein